MENMSAIAAFSALAQPTRLEVFRLLIQHEPGGLASGDVARALDVPHNTMSSHLAILQQAGLVEGVRRSRSVVYRARLDAVRQIVGFLLKDCCNGRPSLCAPILEDLAANPIVMNACCSEEPECPCSNAT
jgi:DNA-binding transcriptional ArsR family regulator